MPGEPSSPTSRRRQQGALRAPGWSEPAVISGAAPTLVDLQTDLERARGEYALRQYVSVEALLREIQRRIRTSFDGVTDLGIRRSVALVEASLETLRGRLLSGQRPEQALAAFKRAVELFDAHADYAERRTSAARVFTDYGIALYRVGWRSGERMDDAIRFLETVCTSGGAPADALGYLGYAKLRRRDLPAAEHWLRKALDVAPGDPTVMYWLARVLEASGQRAEAVEAYWNAGRAAWGVHDPASAARCGLRALRLDRSSERALRLAVVASRANRRPVLACATLGRFLQATPGNPHAVGLHGMILREDGDLDGAIEALRSISWASHEVPWARVELARALLTKDPAYAREALAATEDALRVFPGDVSALLLKAEAELALEDYGPAVSTLRHAAETEDSARILAELGRALLLKKEPAEALQILEKAVRIDPRHSWVRWLLATCLEQLGQLERAANAYQQASRLDPKNPDILEAMLRVLRTLDRRQEARDEIEHHLDGPLRPLALRWKAQFYVDEHQRTRAIECLEAAVQVRTMDAELDRAGILIELGDLRRQEGQYERAGEAYRQAFQLDGQSADVTWAMVMYECGVGRFETGLTLVKGAVARDPGQPDTWYLTGWCHQHLGDFDAALHAYEQAFVLSEPRNPYYRKGLANALYQLGRTSEAEQHFKVVLEAQKYEPVRAPRGEPSPSDANLLATLGWCHYRLGEYDEAVRLFQTALAGGESREFMPLWFDLALVLLASQRSPLAVNAYRRAFAEADREEKDRRRGLYYVALFDLVDATRHALVDRAEADEVLTTMRTALDATGVDLHRLKWLRPEPPPERRSAA